MALLGHRLGQGVKTGFWKHHDVLQVGRGSRALSEESSWASPGLGIHKTAFIFSLFWRVVCMVWREQAYLRRGFPFGFKGSGSSCGPLTGERDN